jgi:hypothetical protein
MMSDDPMFAAIVDYAQLNPGDPLGLFQEEWGCMVCGGLRRYGQISVAKIPLPARLNLHDLVSPVNVRYCNDRPHCTQVATTAAQWPPDEAGDLCIPALKLHATPHRGCVLR